MDKSPTVKDASADLRPASGRDRHAEVRRLIGEMESAALIGEGQFNALGMVVTDASLAADEAALEEAQDGLQWLYRQHAAISEPDADRVERRGRLLGMIDITSWALRRLPSALQIGLDPSSHAGQFLLAVAARPGVSNQELASQLGIDETEASRVEHGCWQPESCGDARSGGATPGISLPEAGTT